MNKTVLVSRREFLGAVRRPGYLVMTLAVPLLAILGIGAFRLALGPSSGAMPAAEGSTGLSAIVVPGVFSLLMALALLLGSTSLVRGLAEEKESRLIEVLLSSVSYRRLLAGKVLGLGAAGLLQILVWVVSLPLLQELAADAFGGFVSQMRTPPHFVVLGLLFFVLGYLLFAVLSIGIGSISSNPQEGGQLSLIYTMASFIPLWFLALLIFFPESPVWVVLTILPVTAPIQVMMRLGFGPVPAWQILASIGVNLGCIAVGMELSVRVFRLFVLKGGKRPGLREILGALPERTGGGRSSTREKAAVDPKSRPVRRF